MEEIGEIQFREKTIKCTGCFKEFGRGETAYATVAGSSEQFYVNYDAKAQI